MQANSSVLSVVPIAFVGLYLKDRYTHTRTFLISKELYMNDNKQIILNFYIKMPQICSLPISGKDS